MRKFALRGLIVLLIVLVGCFFFSGTVKTLTTAKVMFISPKQGKLKEQISLTGYLTFSATEGIRIASGNNGVSFPINRIYVTKGSYVKAGDILMEVDIAGVDAAMSATETIYQDAQKELLALEREYPNLRISRTDQDWLNAYDGLLAAKDASYEAHLHLDVMAQKYGIELINGRIPDDAIQEELISAQAAADQADADVQTAQAAMNKAARSGITDEVYQYTMKRRNLENTLTQAYDSLVVLEILRESRGLIVAPHDGYILDVHVVEGESWSGTTSALTMSAADADCYLRAYVPQNSRTIAVGTQVVVTGMESAQIKTQVAATGFDSDGIPIVDVALRTSDIALLSTPYGLLNNGTRLSINYVASSSTQLIPVSAVRGHGDERYVFTAKMERNSFGQTVYIVEKAPVTVVDETSEYISVSSTDRIGQIIYMEDRAIAKGSTVIPYE